MKKAFFYILVIIPLFNFAQDSNNVDSLFNLIDKSTEDTSIISAYIELGGVYTPLNIDSALLFYEKAYELSQGNEYPIFFYKSTEKIGVINYYKGNFNKAIELFEKAIEGYKEVNSLEGLSSVYNNIGITYARIGKYDITHEYLIKALDIDLQIGDKEQITICYTNLGTVSRKIGNKLKALEYFNDALIIAEEINDSAAIGGCLNSIAAIHYYDNNFQKALDLYLKGLEIAIKHDPISVQSFYTGIGATLEGLGEYDEALEYHKKALENNLKSGNKDAISQSYSHFASNYIQQKKYSVAIEYVNKCLEIAKEIEALPSQQMAYNKLSLAHYYLKDYKKAYDYQVLNTSITESIYNEGIANKIATLETQYEIQKKDKENEVLRLESDLNSLNAQKAQSQRNFFILLVVLAVLIIVFILVRYILKQNANKLLAEKNILITTQKEQLAESLNEVRKLNHKLRLQNTEIEDHRNNLEEIVKERTSELQEKIDLLEHYHKLFISREFRIKELRDELKELKVILEK